MTVVCCLFGCGGEFDILHVARLAAMVRRYSPSGTRIECLTDHPGLDAGLVDQVHRLTSEQLSWGWKGCWPKLAWFQFPGPRLYLDLDVTIVGDLSDLLSAAARHELVACRSFWGVAGAINASVLGWSGAMGRVYETFAADPDSAKARFSDDQPFIAAQVPGFRTWQDLPETRGHLASYKRDLLTGKAYPDLRVCVSHGRPRPWDPDGADAWLRATGHMAPT
jgi:hypothetical protein